jgi:hypothetical protein
MACWIVRTIEHSIFFDRSVIENLDARKEAMTVQRLLDMTSGLEWMEQLPDGFASAIEMERSQDC